MVILVVGDVTGWEKTGRDLPKVLGVAFASYAQLADLLRSRLHPALIVAPLSTRDFDAVELARLLHDSAFKGVFYAVAPPLPAPALVLSEIRRVAPGLLFDLLTPLDIELLKRTGSA